MTGRSRSRTGNVIAADFRPRLTVTLASETLYQDDRIVLIRTTARFGGRTLATTHVLGDLATGHVTTL